MMLFRYILYQNPEPSRSSCIHIETSVVGTIFTSMMSVSVPCFHTSKCAEVQGGEFIGKKLTITIFFPLSVYIT